MKIRSRLSAFILALALVSVPLGAGLTQTACTQNAPPNLSPAGVTAWQATKVIKALDVVRDIAVDASHTTPPLVAHATMLKVVAWHKTAITIAHDSPSGWVGTVKSSLTATQQLLTPAEHKQLDPYFALAVVLLNEVP